MIDKQKIFPFLLIPSFFPFFMVKSCDLPATSTLDPTYMQEPQTPTNVITELSTELPTELLTELPTELPTEVPTEVRTEASVEAISAELTETPEPTPPLAIPVTSMDLGKEQYDSVGIWAIPHEYLEFSLGEMSVGTVDDYFSKASCFFEEPDPLKNNLHIIFNEQDNDMKQDNDMTTIEDSTCWFAMDKTNTGLPENFFATPIMRLIFYSEIDPAIPMQTEKQPLTMPSMFYTRINCSKDPDSSSYSTTEFFIGGSRSYYTNKVVNTYIGPEHSSNETEKKAYVLIIDLRPQFIGYDEKGKEQQRTPVYLYEYVFPDAEDPKDPIEIIHDALMKTANPGTPTDGTLNQEFAEKNGEKIFFSCRLNKANPGIAVGGRDFEDIEGIGINVKILYLIFETQYSIDNSLIEKPYNSLN